MQVSVGLDASLVFCGDTVTVLVEFAPEQQIHILSATLSLQTVLHLGDLVNPDKFGALRARGPVIGHHEAKGGGLLGFFGLSAPKNNLFSLYRSEQQLLCADQVLSSRTSFSATFDVPRDACPTYISKSLEITHQAALEFQLLQDGVAPCLLLLPFRVYPRPSTQYTILGDPPHRPQLAHSLAKDRIRAHVASLLADAREVTPAPDEPLASNLLPTQCRYELVKNKEPLAVIHLARPFFSVGSVVVATVELTSACYHLTVTLEQSENISADMALANSQHTKVVASQSSVVWGLKSSTVQLPIPLQLVPQVDLEAVRNSFSIRIDLACAAGPLPVASPTVSIELVSTSIPVTIVAPSEGSTPASRSWAI